MVEAAIPGRLNLLILVTAVTASATSLMAASHLPGMWWLLAVPVFALAGNTCFSLMHEALHGIAHPVRAWNEAIGIIASWPFPTSLAAQRHFHLGHHRRNRSDVECWDLQLPGDRLWLKRLQLWSILSGWYWTAAPCFSVIHLCAPWLLRRVVAAAASDVGLSRTSAGVMLDGIDHPWRIRGESILSFSWWIMLIVAADLHWWPSVACVAAFAWSWSSLQYVDHAFTARHVDAAWNLRVSPWVRWCFLNYHYHAVHHLHPGLPWLHLGAHLEPQDRRPGFWWVYLRLWLGPYKPEHVPRPR